MKGRGKVIRPPRQMGTEVDFNSAWNDKLAPAISDIHNRNATTRSFEELYRTSYYLVVKKKGEQLYKAVQQKVAEELHSQVERNLAPLLSGLNTGGSENPADGGTSATMGAATAAAAGGLDIEAENGVIISTPKNTSTSATTNVVPDSARMSRIVGFIAAVKNFWIENSLCIKMTSDVMAYLDKAYCIEMRILTVHEKLLELFRECVLRNAQYPIGASVYSSMIELVNLERDGQIIDRMTVKGVVNMLEALPWQKQNQMQASKSQNYSSPSAIVEKSKGGSMYRIELEPFFLKESALYYNDKANTLISEGISMEKYLGNVRTWLAEEEGRCNVYMLSGTAERLDPVLVKVLITDQLPHILERPKEAFWEWVKNEEIDNLSVMYSLLKRADLTTMALRQSLEQHLDDWGVQMNDETEVSRTAVVTNEKGKKGKISPTQVAITWVDTILRQMELLNNVLTNAFESSRVVQALIDTCLARAINRNNRAPEYLSLYMDENLRKGIRGKTDEEISAFLNKSIQLFRYLAEKDQFELYYRMHLAKRLLHARALSDDAEKEFVGKLKSEMGSSSTSKLEGIFADMRISRDHQNRFKEYMRSQATNKCDLNVNVLTSTHWPSQTVTESLFKLPKAVESARLEFEKFYQGAHTGRVLRWNCNMGTSDVKARYGKRIYEINMATPAMVILMLFSTLQEDTGLTFTDIQNLTEIPTPDLIRHLQSLSLAPKTRLLRKQPQTRTVSPSDVFTVNREFTSPTVRFKVLSISTNNTTKAETDSERKSSLDDIQKDRKYEIDAAVVRVMKSRKQLEHALLVSDVTKMLSARFKPDPIMIKQQIHLLVDKEYLERDSNQHNLYRYLA